MVEDIKKLDNLILNDNLTQLIDQVDEKLKSINEHDHLKREIVKIGNKEYYQKTKEKRLEAMRSEYNSKIKDNKVKCECGREVLSNKYAIHCKSKID
jgi:hypothetical protein